MTDSNLTPETINEWSDLIPEAMAWNDEVRREQLKIIVNWLKRQDYAVRSPQWSDDGDGCKWCKWEIFKGETIGYFYWKKDRAFYNFYIVGIPEPEPSSNQAYPLPDFLTWIWG